VDSPAVSISRKLKAGGHGAINSMPKKPSDTELAGLIHSSETIPQ
jgi:hypothetical protein